MVLEQLLQAVDELGLDRQEALRVLMSDDDRLARVKALLGISGVEQDETLLFIIQSLEEQILSYINHQTLPPPLEKMLVLIAVSYYKSAGLGTTQAAVGPIASVKRGDVQTTFATKTGASGSAPTFDLGAEGNDFLGWRRVLQEYRKLRW